METRLPTGPLILPMLAGRSSTRHNPNLSSNSLGFLDASCVQRILGRLLRIINVNNPNRDDILIQTLELALQNGRPYTEGRLVALSFTIARRLVSSDAKRFQRHDVLTADIPDRRANAAIEEVENRMVINQIRSRLITAGNEERRVEAFLLRLAGFGPREIIEFLGLPSNQASIQQLDKWRRREATLLADLSTITGLPTPHYTGRKSL